MSTTPTPRTRSSLRRSVRRYAGAALVAGTAAAVLPLTVADSAVAASGGTTYYVAPNGNDSAAGTSPEQPLKSLGRVEGLNLQPGDKVLLQRGATFTGKLGVWKSGTAAKRITIGSYGPKSAAKPRLTNNINDFCVMVGASYVTVTDVHVTGCRVGIWSRGTENVITRVEATKNMHGIEVDAGSLRTHVVRNHLHHNDAMAANTPGAFDDYGAVGVVVVGDDTEVAFNKITDNWAPSADFGTDGSAVEIYGGIGTVVHHNVARDNRTFTELGNSRSADTTYAYNVATSSLRDSEFIITRGNNDYFGPVRGTVAVNNTVKLTGTQLPRLRLLRRLHHRPVRDVQQHLRRRRQHRLPRGRAGRRQQHLLEGLHVERHPPARRPRRRPAVPQRPPGPQGRQPRRRPGQEGRDEARPERQQGRRRRQRRRQARFRHRRPRGQEREPSPLTTQEPARGPRGVRVPGLGKSEGSAFPDVVPES